MNKQEEDIKLIERFLDQSMSETEREAFAERLKSDEGLKILITEMEVLVEGIRYSARQELLQDLKSLEARISQEEHVPQKETKVIALGSRRTWMAIAAVMALLLVSTFAWQLLQVESSNHVAIADQYIEQHFPSDYSVTRSGAEVETSTPNMAFTLYENGSYRAAAGMFLEILDKEEKADLLFFGANSLLKSGEYQKAINLFETVVQNYPEYEFSCESSFLASCALIKLDKIQEAEQQLNKVTNCEDATIAQNAEKLIEALH